MKKINGYLTGCTQILEAGVKKIENIVVRISEYLHTDNNAKIFSIIFLLIITGEMYVLNNRTTLIADDYSFAFKNTTEYVRIASIKDVIDSTHEMYFSWGGNVLQFMFDKIFSMYSKSAFNVFNTAVFLLMVIALYLHSAIEKKLYAGVFIMIVAMLFAFTPAFGQVFLWLCGSIGYMWPACMALLFLLPYRLQLIKTAPVIQNNIIIFLYGMCGILAGICGPNLSCAIVACILFAMYVYHREHKLVPLWMKIGLIGVVVGFMVLVLAPGNYVRLAAVNSIIGDQWSYTSNFFKITSMTFKTDCMLLPIILFLLMRLFYTQKDDVINFYIVGTIVAQYSMIMSPTFPLRTELFAIIFCIPLVMYTYTCLNFEIKNIRAVSSFMIITSLIVFINTYISARADITEVYDNEMIRKEYMESQINQGNLDIVVAYNPAISRYCAGWGLGDLSCDTKDWKNEAFSKYYGINSIRCIGIEDVYDRKGEAIIVNTSK